MEDIQEAPLYTFSIRSQSVTTDQSTPTTPTTPVVHGQYMDLRSGVNLRKKRKFT